MVETVVSLYHQLTIKNTSTITNATFNNNGETVSLTGKVNGTRIEVVYSNGQKGWEHYADILTATGPLFTAVAADDEKDGGFDCMLTDEVYDSLTQAVDHFRVICAEA